MSILGTSKGKHRGEPLAHLRQKNGGCEMLGMKKMNGYLIGTLMGLGCLAALAPAARADTIFTSNANFCCFSVTLHQNAGDLDDIFVTVALTSGAESFANTG